MKRIVTALTVVIVLHTPHWCLAWGREGHQLIVNMAFTLLSPDAKKKVLTCLNGYPLNSAAVWMDSLRMNRIPGYAYMNDWHFLNMEDGQQYQQVASKNDVVFNLQRAIQQLEGGKLTRDSAKYYLLVLFHLMGDISQPLHCGYGHDVGGNKIAVHTEKYSFGPETNLHTVWDDIIITAGDINLASCVKYYQGLPAATVSAAKTGTPKDWVVQARGYLKTNVYKFTMVQGGISQLSLQYLTSNVPVVQQQIVFAAIRLASVLELALRS